MSDTTAHVFNHQKALPLEQQSLQLKDKVSYSSLHVSTLNNFHSSDTRFCHVIQAVGNSQRKQKTTFLHGDVIKRI